MRITRDIPTPRALAGVLFPGHIDEDAARKILGEDFDLAVKDGALVREFQALPNRGWPTKIHAAGDHAQGIRPSPSHIEPIVKAARFQVVCHSCSYRTDSAVENEKGAIASVASAHDKTHTEYTAIPYPESA